MSGGSQVITAGSGAAIWLALMFGPVPAAAADARHASCPRLTAEAFTRRLTARRVLPARHFHFGGAHFSRASGRADCAMAGANDAAFPVCRFSAPVALQVTTGRGRYDFFPGLGPATVTVRGGEASCVKSG